MVCSTNPLEKPSILATRINHKLAKAAGTCRVCGRVAIEFEDDEIRLECGVLAVCPVCLNTLFGFRQRRRYHRVPQQLPVFYTSDMRLFQSGLSRDISLGGAFILTSAHHSVEDKIMIVFPLARKGRPLRIPGRISRVAEDGVAVVFVDGEQAV
jgi:hypothetical protein